MPAKSRKPAIGKPMAPKKLVRNRQPRGPSRTSPERIVASHRCEREKCGRPAAVYRLGEWVCSTHDQGPALDPACSHSLTGLYDGIERCSYCGGDK